MYIQTEIDESARSRLNCIASLSTKHSYLPSSNIVKKPFGNWLYDKTYERDRTGLVDRII